MLFARHFTIILLILPLLCLADTKTPVIYQNKATQQFIQQMAEKYDFDEAKLTKLFKKVKYQPDVITNIKRPYEKLPWYIYRRHFLGHARISGGVKFWKKHAETLQRAENQYGVPASIIVAIIGVESNYGKLSGGFSTIDALATLAFYYPPRTKFFTKELQQFLLLTREMGVNPLKVKGSYAGAMGWPQFMPSSYRHYAVDYDNNNHKNLLNNPADVIGSIANYLHKAGWHRRQLIAIAAETTGKNYTELLNNQLKTTYSVAELQRAGIKTKLRLNKQRKANLVELQLAKKQQYWLGLHNFYVITRYNSSTMYAMAVYQLAEKIKNRYQGHYDLASSLQGLLDLPNELAYWFRDNVIAFNLYESTTT